LSTDHQNDLENSAQLPDMGPLDAALRDVLNAATQDAMPEPEDLPSQDERDELKVAPRILRQVAEQVGAAMSAHSLPLHETMDVVTRAASAIDELVQRNRSITDAAVRSVEFFRKQAVESAAEVEMLREELRIVREQAEARRIASEVERRELEAELSAQAAHFRAEATAHAAELAAAEDWIDEIRSQVSNLLGNAQTRLEGTSNGDMFRK